MTNFDTLNKVDKNILKGELFNFKDEFNYGSSITLDNPNLAIFRQTDNGLLVRMALFAMTLDVVHLVKKSSSDVPWHNHR